MNAKKVLLTVLAMVLVCVLSVAGTLAYLTNTSGDVTNTFTAQEGLLDPDDPSTSEPDGGTFKIEETPVSKTESGDYVLDESGTSTTSLSFEILPGMTLPKKALVKIDGKTETAAYLFVEIVEDLTSGVYTYAPASCWKELTGVTGPNGGTVYVYSDGDGAIIVTSDVSGESILLNDQVTVDSSVTESMLEAITGDTLKFYGYLCQSAGFDSASAAFTACFPANN